MKKRFLHYVIYNIFSIFFLNSYPIFFIYFPFPVSDKVLIPGISLEASLVKVIKYTMEQVTDSNSLFKNGFSFVKD